VRDEPQRDVGVINLQVEVRGSVSLQCMYLGFFTISSKKTLQSQWYYYPVTLTIVPVTSDGPGQRSRYSDLLRAGRSGDRIPVGARFSAPVQTGPGAYPASCAMGTVSFPGVKRPGRGVDHPPPSSAKVKGRVELYLYSPSGPSWPVLGSLWAFMACSRVPLGLRGLF
jgi:hypothetical protein